MNGVVKISIIIPVYNSEDYLQKCLESVCSQTYKNLEIIIINDGSNDSSQEIINYFARRDNRIIPIKSENFGQSSARNKGINIATGEYIGFVDSDDFIQNNMYEVMVKNAILENADLIQIGHYVIDETNKIINTQNNKRVIYSTFYHSLRARLLQEVIKSSVCDKLFHQSLWKELRMKEGYYYEDGMVLLELLQKAKKVLVLEEVGYCYFLSKSSTQRGPYNVRHLESCLYEPMFYYDFLKNNCNEFIPFAYARYCFRAIRGYRFTQDINGVNKKFQNEYNQIFYSMFIKYFIILKKTEYYKKLGFKKKIAFNLFRLSPKMYLFVYSFL